MPSPARTRRRSDVRRHTIGRDRLIATASRAVGLDLGFEDPNGFAERGAVRLELEALCSDLRAS